MLAHTLEEHDDTPVGDSISLLGNLSWADYERMLEARGEASVPRFAYLEGTLEIMTPSKFHESLASRIGLLVAVWCEEHAVDFSPYGSWTLKSQEGEAGLEPDECYVFGVAPDAERPDLAIEVIWTSGRIGKLDIYVKLGVKEVWFWRRGRISVHILDGGEYVEASASQMLPGLDLVQLAAFLDRPTASQSMREYRAALTGP